MEDLGPLANLRDLWLANNMIRRIKPVLTGCVTLRTLELGANRIKTIEHLEMLTTLENLWLGKNRISQIQNLSSLVKLRKLDLQCNRITQIEGLDALILLEELYLSHNRITRLENLDKLVRAFISPPLPQILSLPIFDANANTFVIDVLGEFANLGRQQQRYLENRKSVLSSLAHRFVDQSQPSRQLQRTRTPSSPT